MVSSSDSNEKIGGILAICKYFANVNLFNICVCIEVAICVE